jgi:tetratricopeptide (TPR) repeat protein
VSPLLRARLELSRADVERVGGRFEAALAHVERADVWLSQHVARLSLPPIADEHRFRATALRGRVLQSLGRFKEALQVYTQATAIAARFDDDQRLIVVEASLAWNHLKCGDVARARDICERTVRAYPAGVERRAELGIGLEDSARIRELFQQKYRGCRYSFGYPACPDMADQEKLWRLLQPERIGCRLTENFQIDPEQSTSAIVVHHPGAGYFAV